MEIPRCIHIKRTLNWHDVGSRGAENQLRVLFNELCASDVDCPVESEHGRKVLAARH